MLGNGDIWEAADALAMVAATGCDGVVVGRGCLGRPWLFADLEAAFAGQAPPPPPPLGEVVDVMAEHARLLVAWAGEERGACGTSASTPAGTSPATRAGRRSGAGWPMVETLAELGDLLAGLHPYLELVPGGQRIHRGHTNGPRPVHLPYGWLDDPDDASPLPPEADALVSGG